MRRTRSRRSPSLTIGRGSMSESFLLDEAEASAGFSARRATKCLSRTPSVSECAFGRERQSPSPIRSGLEHVTSAERTTVVPDLESYGVGGETLEVGSHRARGKPIDTPGRIHVAEPQRAEPRRGEVRRRVSPT